MDESRKMKHERLTVTYEALLMYANANNATCIYFEPPVVDDDMAFRAMQIANELWDDETLVNRCLQSRLPLLRRDIDTQLLSRWVDALHGPVVCMETHDDRALLLCEGSVFEVVSYKRSWDRMVPYVPDVILTTLLPFDDEIAFDGLLLHHSCYAEGLGVQRVQNEFEKACEQGIIRDSSQFVRESRRIRNLWRTVGLDPTSYTVFEEAVAQLNDALEQSCYPYELKLPVREWDAVS